MPRYKLTIEYNGAPFSGWQRVADRPSVQAALEEAALRFSGERVEVVGAGRTDAGVHAVAQVAHVDFTKAHEPFTVMQAMNFHLFNDRDATSRHINPRCVAVVDVERVPDDFHARFSANARHYLYRILNRRAPAALEAGRVWHVPVALDAQAMHRAAQLLLGTHDFTSFRDTQCQAKSPLKTLDVLDVSQAGEEIHIRASARSFLHHQVRILVGTLWQVGRGEWSVDDVAAALSARDRRAGGPTAPAEGLYLTGVVYYSQ